MRYTNGQLKIDQLVGYLNDGKINLIPPFQRGRVWNPSLRSALLKNILAKKPIPAVFLYKEASESRYTYNILDGKQRIESIILFIKNNRTDLCIKNWKEYFHVGMRSGLKNFPVEINDKKMYFAEMSPDIVREFSEYVIPTIEIEMGDETNLQDIVSLFVDINQKGEKVDKFDIVKAIQLNNSLLKYIFNLIAVEKRKKQDRFYKIKKSSYARVLKALSRVENMRQNDFKVNYMWERMLELSIFAETKMHRKPIDISKMFISKSEKDADKLELSDPAKECLRKVFAFLEQAYKTGLNKTKLASDGTLFYTMVTSLIKNPQLLNDDNLSNKLNELAIYISKGRHKDIKYNKVLKEFILLTTKHTTDTSNRETRGSHFVKLLNAE